MPRHSGIVQNLLYNTVMDESLLLTSPLTPEEHATVLENLQFIAKLTTKAKELGYRVIVHGGYAVDGALKKITRPHADLDLQIYGLDEGTVAVPKIITSLDESLLPLMEAKERKEYWHLFHLNRPGSLTELYYVKVATDPFGDAKRIVKSDGTESEIEPFHTEHAVFGDISYEIQNPVTELADKLYKRTVRGDEALTKHDQDMANLVLITDPAKVQEELEIMKQRVE